MIKFHAFIIYLAIPCMGVRVSGLKLVIPPTYHYPTVIINNKDIHYISDM